MSTEKILPGNETVLVIPVVEVNGVPNLVGDTLVPYDAPTVAVLTMWHAITVNGDTGSGAGGNLSGALKDDLTLGLTDSDTDPDRTINSKGQSEALTFFNFDSEFTIFRDASLSATDSRFNMASDLVRAPDVPYMIAHRIGYDETVVPAIGQEWDFYYSWTDNPVPVYADGGNQAVTQTLVPKNVVLPSHTLTV